MANTLVETSENLEQTAYLVSTPFFLHEQHTASAHLTKVNAANVAAHGIAIEISTAVKWINGLTVGA